MVADDATRLRLFRQQLETDGFLNLGIDQACWKPLPSAWKPA
jgi:hypothetical protein